MAKASRVDVAEQPLPEAIGFEVLATTTIAVYFDRPLMLGDGGVDLWGTIRSKNSAGTSFFNLNDPGEPGAWSVTSGNLNRILIQHPAPAASTSPAQVNYDPSGVAEVNKPRAADGRPIEAFAHVFS